MSDFDQVSPSAHRARRAKAGERFHPYPDPPPAQRVRALIMADRGGEVQVLAPERALLDLTALGMASGRELRARPYTVEAPTSAVPGAYGLPVLVDDSLVRADILALATEDPAGFVRARGSDLLDVGLVESAPFVVDVGREPTPADRGRDLARIDMTLSRFTERRMQARLDETLHIPPLPEAARRVIALQADPHFDLADLVQIVETDPSIAARIMGWANSAFYNARPAAATLDDAIIRVLGCDTVMSMALTMALGRTLRLPEAHVRGVSGYWLEAVFTAAAMEALARGIPARQRPVIGLCYLAGLLANFGTLVVGHVFPPQYLAICELQEANRHLPHTYVDQHVLQMPREVLAAALLECWSLPEAVTDAVRYQHLADYQGPNESYVRLLSLTRRLLGHQGITDEPPQAPEPDALDALGLSEAAVAAVLERLDQSSAELEELAGAMSPPAS